MIVCGLRVALTKLQLSCFKPSTAFSASALNKSFSAPHIFLGPESVIHSTISSIPSVRFFHGSAATLGARRKSSFEKALEESVADAPGESSSSSESDSDTDDDTHAKEESDLPALTAPKEKRQQQRSYFYIRDNNLENKLIRALEKDKKISERDTTFVVCNPGDGRLPHKLMKKGARRMLIWEGKKEHLEKWQEFTADNHNEFDLLQTYFLNINNLGSISKKCALAEPDDERDEVKLIPGAYDKAPIVDWQGPEDRDSSLCFIGVLGPAVEKRLLGFLQFRRFGKSNIWWNGPAEFWFYVSATKAAALETLDAKGKVHFRNKLTRWRNFQHRLLYDIHVYKNAPTSFDSFEPQIRPRRNVTLKTAIAQFGLQEQSMYLAHLKAKRSVGFPEVKIRDEQNGQISLFDLFVFLEQMNHRKRTESVGYFIQQWLGELSEENLNELESKVQEDIEPKFKLTAKFLELREDDRDISEIFKRVLNFAVSDDRFREAYLTGNLHEEAEKRFDKSEAYDFDNRKVDD